MDDGHAFLLGMWEEPTGPSAKDWQVPSEEVDAKVRETFDRYDVVGFYADPNKWESWISGWEGEFRDRLLVKGSGSHPIEWWPHERRIVRAVEQLLEAILEKDLTYDGAPELTRHLLNARRKMTNHGVTITKEHASSARKIDGAIALDIPRP